MGPLCQKPPRCSEPVIFVDGGTHFRQNKEGFSVGDGDSFSGPLDETLNPHKDYSDLAYVLASLPKHFHQLFLHGFLGGRRDHEWANFGEMQAFLGQRNQPTQVDLGQGVYAYNAGQWQLNINEIFSLLCVETCKVTLTGACRYQLEHQTKLSPFSSHGLSNIGHGLIQLHTDKPVYVITPDKVN